MTTTTNFGWTLVEPNQANKHITVNEALQAIDTTLSGLDAADPPLGGDLSGTAAAATVTKLQGIAVSTTDPTLNQVLAYNGTAWEPAAPATTSSVTMGGDVTGSSGTSVVAALQGIAVSTTDPTTGQTLVYDGTSWAPATHPYDLALTVTGVTTTNEKLMRFVAPRAVNFVANFSTSTAKAGTAATATTVFTIAKNGSTIGTVTFAAAGTTGTWASSSGTAYSLASGDVLTLTAPATPDSTLADIGFTFVGTR